MVFLDRYLLGLRELLFPLPAACLWCGVAASTNLCQVCKLALQSAPAFRCARCRRALHPATYGSGSVRCAGCRVSPPAYAGVTFIGIYEGLCRWTVQAIKTRKQPVLLISMARLLAEELLKDRTVIDVVVPLPTDRHRVRRRGFDHAVVLAEQVAARLGRPCLPGVLQRSRAAPPQSSLQGAARRRNAAGLYRLPAGKWSLVRGRRVLLVDDVVSTGSSLNSAARTLLKAGAVQVWAGVIADNVTGGGVEHGRSA